MKGVLRVVRDQELKLTLPGPSVTIKPDGTIWYGGTPLLGGITDPVTKRQLASEIEAGNYDNIPDNAWTRLGDNPNGLWAGDDDAWAKHPAKLTADKKEAAKKEQERKMVTIYLSSRGWGDYSPVEWHGDITRPDEEILAECKKAMSSAYDVDQPDQTDGEIISKITDARKKWEMPEEPAREITHGPGYCYFCESYCYGDCGDYSSNPQTKYRRDLADAQREQSYGINDG